MRIDLQDCFVSGNGLVHRSIALIDRRKPDERNGVFGLAGDPLFEPGARVGPGRFWVNGQHGQTLIAFFLFRKISVEF